MTRMIAKGGIVRNWQNDARDGWRRHDAARACQVHAPFARWNKKARRIKKRFVSTICLFGIILHKVPF